MISVSYSDYLTNFSKEAFDLDTKQLTQQFRSLQSQLHPDKFSLKSEVNVGCIHATSTQIVLFFNISALLYRFFHYLKQ